MGYRKGEIDDIILNYLMEHTTEVVGHKWPAVDMYEHFRHLCRSGRPPLPSTLYTRVEQLGYQLERIPNHHGENRIHIVGLAPKLKPIVDRANRLVEAQKPHLDFLEQETRLLKLQVENERLNKELAELRVVIGKCEDHSYALALSKEVRRLGVPDLKFPEPTAPEAAPGPMTHVLINGRLYHRDLILGMRTVRPFKNHAGHEITGLVTFTNGELRQQWLTAEEYERVSQSLSR